MTFEDTLNKGYITRDPEFRTFHHQDTIPQIEIFIHFINIFMCSHTDFGEPL